MPLLLTERDLAPLLAMQELIDLMERTLADFSSGRAIQPVRTTVSLAAHDSFLAVMPGYLPTPDALAVKLVSFTPANSARGIPTHFATILVFDASTGALIAIMDGRLVTERRTAAVSAAAARALAKPRAESLALLGSGVQASSHLEALKLVRPIARARVWSPTPAHREAFARQHSARWGLPVTAVGSAAEAVRGADLIVTATSSRTAVLRGEWLSPGTHVTAVGAPRPEWRELDGAAIKRASVFVDSLAGARVESGDLIQAEKEGAIARDHARGEIGAVFAGAIPGRTREDEITLFKSLGMAVEDVAAAQHVFRRARDAGIGIEVSV
jgi:ornithine cyclodeaminase/alanine dehydrogenase-like protein (mu-crystallin family)